MPTNYKIVIAALVGFLLGALLFHSRHDKIYVQQVEWGNASAQAINGGTEVVGFSCVQIGPSSTAPLTQCLVATR
jgi:hypothetical protein